VNVTHGELHLTYPDGSEKTFVPLQFHFHAPSEHTIDGRLFDLEMHLVHKEKETGALGTVLGIIFDVEKGGDQHNAFIESLSVDKAQDLEHHHVTDDHCNDGYYEAKGAVAL
jgi:carbonic anhydrase